MPTDPTQLTIGELSASRQAFLSQQDVFSATLEELAYKFLQPLLGLPAGTRAEEVASTYRTFVADAPAGTGSDFWLAIAKELLHFDKEPRAELLKLVHQSTSDLASIAEHLEFISKEITKLEQAKNANGRLLPAQRYYRHQLDYFREKNESARTRIVEFLTHGLKGRALRAAESSPWRQFTRLVDRFFPRSPYGYMQKPSFPGSSFGPYDVRSVHDLSNKFLDLDVPTYVEVRKLYDSNRDEFYKIAAEYIVGDPGVRPSVANKINAYVSRSHILDRRKQLMSIMLAHFQSKDYLSFVSMAPLQIEGIFGDVCKELGIPETRLDISSLNDKLELIDDKLSGFRYLEYYAFKFPVLRNTVAHGELVDGDLEHTAIQLLLDLLPVCEFACAAELPTMRALAALDKLTVEPTPAKLLDWIELRGTPIPAFYDRTEKIAQTDRMYDDSAFWTFVREKLRTADDRAKLKELVGRLKAAGLAHDQCVEFLKNYSRWIAEADERPATVLPKLNPPAEAPGSEVKSGGTAPDPKVGN